MILDLDIDRLAERSASAIETAFNAYQTEFKSITRRAKARFEQRDWHGAQSDAVARLELYKKNVGENDIFPEEFIKFYGLQPNVKDVFLQAWQSIRRRVLDEDAGPPSRGRNDRYVSVPTGQALAKDVVRTA